MSILFRNSFANRVTAGTLPCVVLFPHSACIHACNGGSSGPSLRGVFVEYCLSGISTFLSAGELLIISSVPCVISTLSSAGELLVTG